MPKFKRAHDLLSLVLVTTFLSSSSILLQAIETSNQRNNIRISSYSVVADRDNSEPFKPMIRQQYSSPNITSTTTTSTTSRIATINTTAANSKSRTPRDYANYYHPYQQQQQQPQPPQLITNNQQPQIMTAANQQPQIMTAANQQPQILTVANQQPQTLTNHYATSFGNDGSDTQYYAGGGPAVSQNNIVGGGTSVLQEDASSAITQTISYPYLTTRTPIMHHRINHIVRRPASSKVVAARYHRPVIHQKLHPTVPQTIAYITPKEYPSEEDYFDMSDEMDQEIAANIHRTVAAHHAPTHYIHNHSPKFPVSSSSSAYGASSYGSSAHSGLGGFSGAGDVSFMPSGYGMMHHGGFHHEPSAHHIPIIAEVHTKPSFDLKKFGIIALVKIGLAKLKAFGILKIIFLMLLKLKLFLLAIFIKFILFLKAVKLLKALFIPLILLSLLPLLLLFLPLLLLPFLSLFLLLPTPGISTGNSLTTQMTPGSPSGGKILDAMKMPGANNREDAITEVLRQLIDSQDCIERIACQMATKREARILSSVINWYMEKLRRLQYNSRLTTYVKAYLNSNKEYKGSDDETTSHDWCFRRYACPKDNSTIVTAVRKFNK